MLFIKDDTAGRWALKGFGLLPYLYNLRGKNRSVEGRGVVFSFLQGWRGVDCGGDRRGGNRGGCGGICSEGGEDGCKIC